MDDLPEGQIFTTYEVARIFGVNPGTVVRWIKEGHLRSHRTPGGHNRIKRDDLVAFLAACGRADLAILASPLSILIIDDDRTVYEIMKRDLARSFGERVSIEWAGDGFEGGRKVAESRPQLVFLDLMMPGIDGFEVCRNIRRDPKSAECEIVALTGFYSEENERRILEAGAVLCLAKPLDLVLIRGFVGRRLMGIDESQMSSAFEPLI